MRAELFWIPGPWRGKLAIAARPRGGDWLEDEALAWRHAGIDVIVSLLENDEAAQLNLLDERRAAENHGIAFLSFPIPDRSVPASIAEAASLMARIAAQLDAGKNVAVHCRQGLGRSGMVASGVLMSSGTGPDEAMQAVSRARGAEVPETQEQRRWMRLLPTQLLATKA